MALFLRAPIRSTSNTCSSPRPGLGNERQRATQGEKCSERARKRATLYLGVQPLEQVLGQRGQVAEALQGGVQEAGVAQVSEAGAHPVHLLPPEAGLDTRFRVDALLLFSFVAAPTRVQSEREGGQGTEQQGGGEKGGPSIWCRGCRVHTSASLVVGEVLSWGGRVANSKLAAVVYNGCLQ